MNTSSWEQRTFHGRIATCGTSSTERIHACGAYSRPFDAASIAKIRNFLRTAETDTNGDRWVTRESLSSALRTPPGAQAPDAPPDVDGESPPEDEPAET